MPKGMKPGNQMCRRLRGAQQSPGESCMGGQAPQERVGLVGPGLGRGQELRQGASIVKKAFRPQHCRPLAPSPPPSVRGCPFLPQWALVNFK